MVWVLENNIELLVIEQNAKQPLTVDVSKVKTIQIYFIPPLYKAEKPSEDNPIRVQFIVREKM